MAATAVFLPGKLCAIDNSVSLGQGRIGWKMMAGAGVGQRLPCVCGW